MVCQKNQIFQLLKEGGAKINEFHRHNKRKSQTKQEEDRFA